jgi:hypothetical protein
MVKQFFIRSLFLVLTTGWSFAANSQVVQKWSFSGFSSIDTDDSSLVCVGQAMDLQSTAPVIRHGYYPLSSSLVKIDESNVQEITVFPNPATDFLFIDGLTASDRDWFEISSLDGKIVSSADLDSNVPKVAVAHLSQGIYQLRIFNADHFVASFKIQIR